MSKSKSHADKIERHSEKLADHNARIRRLEDEEISLRKEKHGRNGALQLHEARITSLEERLLCSSTSVDKDLLAIKTKLSSEVEYLKKGVARLNVTKNKIIGAFLVISVIFTVMLKLL